MNMEIYHKHMTEIFVLENEYRYIQNQNQNDIFHLHKCIKLLEQIREKQKYLISLLSLLL